MEVNDVKEEIVGLFRRIPPILSWDLRKRQRNSPAFKPGQLPLPGVGQGKALPSLGQLDPGKVLVSPRMPLVNQKGLLSLPLVETSKRCGMECMILNDMPMIMSG